MMTTTTTTRRMRTRWREERAQIRLRSQVRLQGVFYEFELTVASTIDTNVRSRTNCSSFYRSLDQSHTPEEERHLLEEWAAHYQASADECNQDSPETVVPDLWDIPVRVS